MLRGRSLLLITLVLLVVGGILFLSFVARPMCRLGGRAFLFPAAARGKRGDDCHSRQCDGCHSRPGCAGVD